MKTNILKDNESLVLYFIFKCLDMGVTEDDIHHALYEYCAGNNIRISIPRIEELVATALYIRANREELLRIDNEKQLVDVT